jgi:osmotically-inducible protein OsmY
VGVEGGEVRLGGNVRRRSTAEALPGHVARVAGVIGVVSELHWLEDDSKPERVPIRDRARYPL